MARLNPSSEKILNEYLNRVIDGQMLFATININHPCV